MQAEANPRLISHDLYQKPRGRGQTGAQGILVGHLGRVLEQKMSAPQRQVARRILEALVTSQKRRAVKSRGSLLTELKPGQAELLPQVLDILVDNRLLRAGRDNTDDSNYELAHDYLLAEIELDPETQTRKAAQELLAKEVEDYWRFHTLLNEDKFNIIYSQRDYLVLNEMAHELLERSQAAIEAEALEKEAQRQRELVQAKALAEEQRKRAQEALARQEAETKARQEAEAREVEQKRATKQLRRLLVGLAAVLVIALAAMGFAFRQSNRATAQQLAANALLEFNDSNYRTATLLALEARNWGGDQVDTTSLDQVPYQAAITTKVTHLSGYTGNAAVNIAWSPDGSQLAVGDSEAGAAVWDGTTGAKMLTLAGYTGSATNLAWSSDSHLVAVPGNNQIDLWNTTTGDQVTTLRWQTNTITNSVTRMAWSPDNRCLAAGFTDNTLVIWDLKTGNKPITYTKITGAETEWN